jgi:hypothetical protein
MNIKYTLILEHPCGIKNYFSFQSIPSMVVHLKDITELCPLHGDKCKAVKK